MQFEVYKKKRGERSDKIPGTTKPSVYPCFELVFNDGWNDYGVFSWFSLWFFIDPDITPVLLGELKIIDRNQNDTFETIPKKFDSPLQDNFFSLGMDIYYYKGLCKLTKEDRQSVLHFLRDIGSSTRLYEKVSSDPKFKDSLIRDLASRQALSHAKFILSKRPVEEAYSFDFDLSEIENMDSNIKWNVSIPFEAMEWSRLIGIIGNNGVGKTYLLRNLAKGLCDKDVKKFHGKLPLFDNLFILSSTSHDKYYEDGIANKEAFHLTYLDNTEKKELESDLRGINDRQTIKNQPYVEVFHDLLKNCIGEQIACVFSYKTEESEDGETHKKPYIDLHNLEDSYNLLSSGQRHILHMVTSLFAHIHMSSLVIIDEPEVHMHPKALIEFMDALLQVLVLFDSFAIIATHSPLIVREILTSNVYLMKRLDHITPSISKVHFNTFGEDIALLYSRIFNYDEGDSIFTRIVSHQAKKSKTAAKLIEYFEHNIGDLSLNAKMRMVDIFEQENSDA